MKINKAKLLVGTLAVIATAATVGSISGTVAWFQYSTRSTVAYQGATAHCSENLQIRLYKAAVKGTGTDQNPQYPGYDSGWKSDLRFEDVQRFMAFDRGFTYNSGTNEDYNLYPITSGDALDSTNTSPVGVATQFYKSPIYQYSGNYDVDYANHAWKPATTKDYVELPIQLRVHDVNGDKDALLAKDVFLTDLTIAQPAADKDGADDDDHSDITPAIRVGFDAENDVTFSANGETTTDPVDETVSIDTCGYLDLNADGRIDKKEGYEDFENLNDFLYGTTGSKETTYNAGLKADANHATRMIADDSDPYNIVGKKLGTTNDSTTGDPLSVTVRIYLEGWQKLQTSVNYVQTDAADKAALDALAADGKLEAGAYYRTKAGGTDEKIYKYTSGNTVDAALTDDKDTIALWDETEFVGARFQVGMRFSVKAHNDGQE